MNLNDLNAIANRIRSGSIQAIYNARSGHPGGCLSIAEMLAVLYFDEMNVRPDQPNWLGRDRFILSKGHACPAYYIALGMKGYFAEEEALTLRKIDSRMEGHPDVRIPGVDAPSGSLGMGLSQGLGMALGGRFQNMDFRTFVLLGDGDMQEGNTWEAIMAAGHHKVSSLTALYDANKLQGDASVADQMNMGDVAAKVQEFGWQVLSIDGHSIEDIQEALATARSCTDKPTFIVADTVKGKGVSFMENVLRWHGSVTMTDEELHASLIELGVN
ncbi:transketolase [Kordiimonas sediminis]|uniref:Transketolase n=1 Tax=Kordiimonas sediminis TaxID=1735581 RepID=A0A919EAV2_9PROT|nr:transketolase [Kordiimonas sediminis]GHF29503.1 transketolase [Kordiimonas sediminis]